MGTYYERLIDKTLQLELQAFGAVLIMGPKWCGKTTTALRFANSFINLQDPINKNHYLEIISVSPDSLLSEQAPMLIDEWQEAPHLWDYVRQTIDRKKQKGLYILTGSALVDSKKISHSGVGRISRLLMRTLSLYESNESNGQVSLLSLFNKESFTASKAALSLEDYSHLVVRGGFPETINGPEEIVTRQVNSYLDIITTQEIKTVYGGIKNAHVVRKVLQSLARHSGTQASNATIIKDLANDNVDIYRDTLNSYLNTFKDLFIIEDLPAWTPKLRSKANVRTVDTRYFIDPAFAARLLHASAADLFNDLNTFGLLFENLVIRDLRIYLEYLGGHVSHYRDSYGHEADAVLHLADGRYGLVEIKLGKTELDSAAKNLQNLVNSLATTKKPSFLLIIYGGDLAYQRNDGVYVVPIGCLKP